jgi:hypothetical protein
MPRPLTPISDERVSYYEEQLKHVFSIGDKEEIKRLKRLFLVYIEKRNVKITAFKNKSIYQYFTGNKKPKATDILKKEIKELKDYKKNYEEYMLKKAKEDFQKDISNKEDREFYVFIYTLLLDYFSNNLTEYNDETKKWVEEYVNLYREQYEYSDERIEIVKRITEKKKKLKYLIDKKYKMREYRNKIKRSGIELQTQQESELEYQIQKLKEETINKESELFNAYNENLKMLKSDYELRAKWLLREYKKELAKLKKIENRINEKMKTLEALRISRIYLDKQEKE